MQDDSISLDASSDLFWLGLIYTALTAIASFRTGDIKLLVIPQFFIGWLVNELAWFHLGLQLILALWFITDGALSHSGGWLGLLFCAGSCYGLYRLHEESHWAGFIFAKRLREGLGNDYQQVIDSGRAARLRQSISPKDWLRPFRMRRPGVSVSRNINYGSHPRERLDIYRTEDDLNELKPVLLQIHGGGWVIGDKKEQALPLMYHMAERGWLCIAINYPLSPKACFPEHIVSVKKALHWIKQEISNYGGDPNFIVATGGSAGGHLSSLLALTANRYQDVFQPGFEDADTSVNACVPFYGVYDFVDRNKYHLSRGVVDFLADYVMQCPAEENPELWDLASPLVQVNENAPPMMVIHGTHDSLAVVEEARALVDALQSTSKQKVVYVELPITQHAFEIFHSVRTEYMINNVAWFVEYYYQLYLNENNAQLMQSAS